MCPFQSLEDVLVFDGLFDKHSSTRGVFEEFSRTRSVDARAICHLSKQNLKEVKLFIIYYKKITTFHFHTSRCATWWRGRASRWRRRWTTPCTTGSPTGGCRSTSQSPSPGRPTTSASTSTGGRTRWNRTLNFSWDNVTLKNDTIALKGPDADELRVRHDLHHLADFAEEDYLRMKEHSYALISATKSYFLFCAYM